MIGVWVFLAWMLLAEQGVAATYYVDVISGLDSSAGTRTEPWKYMPGMTQRPASTPLVAGDIVCLKGGVVWDGALTPPAGVTIASVTGSRLECQGWGVGEAVIDVPSVANKLGAIMLFGPQDAVVLDGISAINRNTTGLYTRCGIYVEGSSSDHVANPVIRRSSGRYSENGVCLIGYVDGFTIEDSQFIDNDTTKPACSSSGILLSAKGTGDIHDGMVQRNSATRNGRSCFDQGMNEGRGLTLKNTGTRVVVQDNWFYDNGALPDGPAVDAGGYTEVTFRRNVLHGFVGAEIKAGANGWDAYDNVIIGTQGGALQYGYWGGKESVGSHWYRNDLWSMSPDRGAVSLSSPGDTSTFNDNTIHCLSATSPAIVFEQKSGQWAQNSWNRHVSGNLTIGCGPFSAEVNLTGGHTFRTREQHKAVYPLQADGPN